MIALLIGPHSNEVGFEFFDYQRDTSETLSVFLYLMIFLLFLVVLELSSLFNFYQPI